MKIRLQKYLADAGIASRRKAEEYISLGRVSVNGIVVTELGFKADTESDEVLFDGKPITGPDEHIYIMLHKPEGYVTTVSDEQGRPTVMELVKEIHRRVVPVGRLDYNTSGLLLMTSDGELTYRLTHPSREVEKKYLARVAGITDPADLRRLRSGVVIDGIKTAPADVKVVKTDNLNGKDSTLLLIGIHEGRNRQIRKMCDAVGHPIIALKRIGTGKISLGELPKGEYRYLEQDEIKYLKRL